MRHHPKMCHCVQVQAKALRGVGAALPALAAGALGSPGTAAALDTFLDAVDTASKATQPTEMRAAAVQALQASSLLQAASADSGKSKAQCAVASECSHSRLQSSVDRCGCCVTHDRCACCLRSAYACILGNALLLPLTYVSIQTSKSASSY